MVTLQEAVAHLKKVKLLVVGDFVLDIYTTGDVKRISPEAPVPVLLVSGTERLPGGAGNVALNLKALGAEVSVLGRIGEDDAGRCMQRELEESGLDTEGLFIQKGYPTPFKNRLIAGGQQLMRADYERTDPIDAAFEAKIKQFIEKRIDEFDLITVSDYAKGFLSETLLRFLLERTGKKVIVDPKGSDFTKYKGAFLVKPNEKEAYSAANLPMTKPLDEVAKVLFSHLESSYLIVTRSEKGMALFSKDLKREDFPVVQKDVMDVTGAGDTALAMIAFSLANDLSLEHGVMLANIASSLAIEKLGCATVKLSAILQRLLEKDPLNKIFYDDANRFILEKVLQEEEVILLKIDDEEEISSHMIRSIRELAEMKRGARLIIHIPSGENQDLIHLLASLYEVDLVLVGRDGLDHPFLIKATSLEVVQL